MSEKNDRIQFARLIDEMMGAASGHELSAIIDAMAVSMDLSIGEVNKMLDHAVQVWESAKQSASRNKP